MNPSNSNSPLSPASGGSNPVSFRPNVNRAKTKRWVEAKQYSYDGGDWGSEDEEEEEEEEQPPAPVRPPYATQRTTSSSELSSRRLPGLGLGSEESRASPGVEPKDQQPSQQGVTGALQSGESAPLDSEGPSVSKSTQNSSMGLPEQTTDPNPDQNALRHNPSQASGSSQGFRSVVHQAFDVPETPDSTANSVTRSNSDGTSVISPIMGQRVPADDKTPTIPEEPADSSTPTGVPTENAAEAPFFKPGHRRDMSLPERDNSPSKRPLVTDHETPAAGQAELTSVPPEQEKKSPERPVEAGTQPTIPSTNATEGDFVAPLKFGSAGTSGSEGYRGSIPAIVGANTSPNEADNDRLREEIMRSLSRENSQEPEEQPRPSHYGNPNEDSIPQQYEKYWDNSTGPGEGTPKALASETHPGWASSNTTASQDPYAAPPQAAQPLTSELPQRPKLGRRFSWESSSSADEPAQPIPGSYQSPPDGLAAQEPEPIPDYDDSHLTAQGMTDGEVSGTESQKAERPRLSIVPPVSQNTTPPEQVIPAVKESNLDLSLPDYTRSSTVDESKLQGFRDILQITTPVARIRAFEETRNQFAVLDTGLNHWLQVTLHDQPQHAHLVQESQTLSSGFPKSSPTTRRFPKLTSLGTLSASREDGTPTSASHVRRPSGHIGTIVNRQNVEQRGKEFLHTAGTFGGKAGEAAKGLFAKGRSKFRQGGNDKVDT